MGRVGLQRSGTSQIVWVNGNRCDTAQPWVLLMVSAALLMNLTQCQLRDCVPLETMLKVVSGSILSWLYQQLKIIRNGRRVLVKTILAWPVCIAGEKDYAAAIRLKLANESQHQCYVAEMCHLEARLIFIFSGFRAAHQIPVIGAANNAGQRWEPAVRDLSGDGAGEVVNGRKTSEIKLTN
ncbi:hypothetical protein GJ744_000809 [Endocarpon pusillum]|uniref:Uncharacterized protein n=1 Tax=Endocarpon pusillum TaxID=364733 RepID=A0A8H7E8W4_9EURO|nr:hypothetical protein GJ744_000809 [Endocarpon pusillum]